MDYKMDYETFRQEMKKLVEEGLRGKGEYSLSWNTVHKNNVTKKGLIVYKRQAQRSVYSFHGDEANRKVFKSTRKVQNPRRRVFLFKGSVRNSTLES